MLLYLCKNTHSIDWEKSKFVWQINYSLGKTEVMNNIICLMLLALLVH